MRKNTEYYLRLLILSAAAVVIGLMVGALTVLFSRVLIVITGYRENHIFYLLPFLSFVGLFIIYGYQKYGKNTFRGMELVFAVGNGEEEMIPKRMIPLIILDTWLTQLFGGSAGRASAVIQIGAVIGHSISYKVPYKQAGKILLIAGMAAGFGGVFQTPIAGIFFAMEVLIVGKMESQAVIPIAVAAFTASITTHLLGLEKFIAIIDSPGAFHFSSIWRVLLLGFIFGIIGGIFAFVLEKTKYIVAFYFPNPYKRIFVMGLIVSILLLFFHTGRYSGLGANLISKSFENGAIFSYDWLVKMVLTIITLAAGFQGGEVTPLFAIGSTVGIVLAPMVGLPLTFVAALGYISVFAAATNTFMAPLFLGVELFGYEYLPFFFLVVIVAYTFNGNQSIYSGQKNGWDVSK